MLTFMKCLSQIGDVLSACGEELARGANHVQSHL